MRFNKFLIGMIFIFLIVNVCALRINEVELNPVGTDAGSEWVELYSEEEVDLTDYKLVNNDGDEIILNESFSQYYVYTFNKQWLDNSDEKVFLYSGNELIDKTDLFKDDKNNDKTWQSCDEWIFIESTKGEESNCGEDEEGSSEQENKIEPINNDENGDKEDTQLDTQLDTNENIINLNPQQEIESKDNKIIYKSKNEKIKNYSIYVFALFLVFIIIILLIKD